MHEPFALSRLRWSPMAVALLAIAACGGRTSGTSPAASCSDNGTVHANGTYWPCSDGCNSCSCENGQIGSTSVGCSLAGPDAAPSCIIAASNYDQSCAADSDCVGVAAGNYCGSNPTCNCGGFTNAISVAALGQFNADVAKTSSGPQVTCPCPMSVEPPNTSSAVCCKHSTCGVCTTTLQPVCTPGATQCFNGISVQTCGPDGQWESAPMFCGNTLICENGACVSLFPVGDAAPQPPSCAPGGPGMTNCGPGGSGTESCCTSLDVPGGTYYRTFNIADSTNAPPDGGWVDEADPATVSSFRLDKYDVTLGRFRQFAVAWSNGWTPPAGSGRHTHLNGGAGLVDVSASSDAATVYETGWLTSDSGNVAPTNTNLACCSSVTSPDNTWTNSAGSQENLPLNYANWYEAYAFCIWDGGFLPSEAEQEYATAGGGQQREYPWGTMAPGTANEYAIYDCNYPSMADYRKFDGRCLQPSVAMIAPVGTAALGAGRWGQLDLTGNMGVWALDWKANYADPCTDCAYLDGTSGRVMRGGDYGDDVVGLLASGPIWSVNPIERAGGIGFRCARTP